jgi:Zn-dependent M28 family amino/carboxypeptidase
MKDFGALFAEYMRNGAMLEAARKAGVAALMLESTRPRGLLYRHPVTFNGTMAPLPVALVSREHAARLGRLLEKGPVQASLTLSIATGPPFISRNVVADIRGSEKPEEIVLIGAHIDSWDLGTGALDNGVNCAMLIDVARGIVELGLVPRRTIRFVLFTGEEQGFWGSAAYVGRHANELDDHVVAAIFDIGSGRISGFYLNGREELRRPVDEALWAVASLGPFRHERSAVDGTDNFDFLLSGVPNLIADQDPAPYLPDYHAESDVFERVDLKSARNNAAVASVLAWEMAQRPGRPAPRQTREEVESLLKSTGLDSIMKTFGQWDGWVSGRRGRHGGGS